MSESTPLLDGKLTLEQKILLANLSQHPGFKILDMMIREAVDIANRKPIELSPKEPNYRSVLASLTGEARAANMFAQAVLRSIAYHVKVAEVESKPIEQKVAELVNQNKK
jgi:hypothetical protein